MTNKEIILSVIDAFDNNNIEQILNHFSENIEWNMVGDQTFSGKQSISAFFAAGPDMKMIASTKDHIVIDGDVAVVDGNVQCEDKAKGVYHDMYYCDIYELENGKVKKMTTYIVNKNKAENVQQS